MQDDDPQVLTVQEEVEVGTELGTVEAVDEDIGENSMIDYLITCKMVFLCLLQVYSCFQ